MFLKEINEELTKLIDKKGGSFFSHEKAKTFDSRPISIQLKVYNKDIINSKRRIKIKKIEYQKLKERFNIISQEGYKLSLKNDIGELKR